MEFNEYQRKSRETASYPFVGSNFAYTALGVAGEAGEMLNIVKKIIRDDGKAPNPERREQIAEEMGDLLWYLSQLASELDLDLETVAEKNIEKIQKIYGTDAHK